jgi:hypothetical protein
MTKDDFEFRLSKWFNKWPGSKRPGINNLYGYPSMAAFNSQAHLARLLSILLGNSDRREYGQHL